MNNIQKAFAAKKQIGIRMADGGPVNSVGDAWNAIAGRIAERGPTLSTAPVQNAANQIRQHVAQTGYPGDGSGPKTTPVADAIASIRGRIAERGYPGQPTQAPVVASNAPAQKFADGGRADMRGGGHLRGPGTGTSDSIPAMLSDGEYVLPADTVKHIGKENLDLIKEATHENNGIRSAGNHFKDGVYVPPKNARAYGGFEPPTSTPRDHSPFVRPDGSITPGESNVSVRPNWARPNVNLSNSTDLSTKVRSEKPNFTFGDNGVGSASAEPKPNLPAVRLNEVPLTGKGSFTDVEYKDVKPPRGPMGGAEAFGQKIGGMVRNGTSLDNTIKLNKLGNVAAVAGSFAPHWGAYGEDSGLNGVQKGQLFARDSLRSLGIAAGAAVGGGVGAAAGTLVAPVAGSLAGGLVGGTLGGYHTGKAVDGVMNDIRQGSNWVNEKLGGSKEYFEDSDKFLSRAGYDPSRSLADMALGKKGWVDPATKETSAAPLPSSDSYPDIRGSAADNVAARNAPANALEGSNVKMGVPLDDQRGAAHRSVGDLRSWNAPNPIAQGAPKNGGSALSADEFSVADRNFKAATGGIRAGTTTNLGNFGGSGDIFATKKNGQVSLTGTGDGSAAAEYEKSAQYQDGIRRAAADKALLNELTAKREAGGGQGGGVSVLGNGGGNGGMTMEQTLRATQEAAMGGGMTRGDKNRALQREQIAAQREQAAAQNKTAMFGHQIQDNNNMRSYQSSMFGHEATMRNNQILRQMDERKYQAERGDKQFEQGIRGAEFSQKKEQDSMANTAAAKTQFNAELESRNVGGDGKPDARAIAAQRTAVEQSLADLGYSHGEMNKNETMKEQLLAGAKLIDKVNAGASHWNPFMADFMRTVKPHQLAGMKLLPNGDAQTPDYIGPDGKKVPGQIIEKRFFSKQNSDRFYGTPTDEFSSLFAKETK